MPNKHEKVEGITGVYRSKNSFYYRALVNGVRLPVRRFSCPLLAHMARMKLLHVSRQFTFTCEDCKEEITVIPKKWSTRKPKRCLPCRKKRQYELSSKKRREGGYDYITKTALKVPVYNRAKRSCLRCGKMFHSLHTHNRVCEKCFRSRNYDKIPHKMRVSLW